MVGKPANTGYDDIKVSFAGCLAVQSGCLQRRQPFLKAFTKKFTKKKFTKKEFTKKKFRKKKFTKKEFTKKATI